MFQEKETTDRRCIFRMVQQPSEANGIERDLCNRLNLQQVCIRETWRQVVRVLAGRIATPDRRRSAGGNCSACKRSPRAKDTGTSARCSCRRREVAAGLALKRTRQVYATVTVELDCGKLEIRPSESLASKTEKGFSRANAVRCELLH